MELYLFYAVASLLWNAMAAGSHRRHAGVGRARRTLSYAAFGLTLGVVPWVNATNAYLGSPIVFALALALPLAFALAAAQCVLAARAGQRLAWALAVYDGFLALVLLVRWLGYLGLAAPPPLASLSLAYAAVQSILFLPSIWLPAFVHLPWIARPSAAPQSVTRFAWGVGVVFAAITLLLTAWTWAPAWRAVGSWTEGEPVAERTAAGERRAPLVRSSQVLETLHRAPEARHLEGERQRLETLGLEAATISFSTEAFYEGSALASSLERFAARNRADGRRLLVRIHGPPAWYQGVPPPAEEIARTLGPALRRAAARLSPDWIAVLGDRVAADALLGAGLAPAAGTVRALDDSARAGYPGVRTIVGALEPLGGSRGGRDTLAVLRERLLRWAAADTTPVDAIGFAFHPGLGGRPAFEERLAEADRMLEALAPGKRAWVLEFAASPTAFGEPVQRAHLERVLAWARERPAVAGVNQVGLGDWAETVGLVTALGRRRPAFEAYRQASSAARR